MEKTLVLGLAAFFLAVVAQIVVWNLFIVRRPLRTLVFIFLSVPALVVALGLVDLELDLAQLTASVLLAYFCSTAYVFTYPAFQEDIPSFRILLIVRASENQGIDEPNILGSLANSALFSGKADDMIDDGMIEFGSDRIQLTSLGALIARSFSLLRKWLGLTDGDG